MENEYIIIGDLHGDITILFNVINNVFHIDISNINNNNSKDLLKEIINSNKIIILLGDIFDPFHEPIYDIKYYEFNKYNNIYHNEISLKDYKEKEFINCYNIIKILKYILKNKLILILGNHDIRYYKQFDITEINLITDNNIINEIKEYLTFINNNFVLYYKIYNKIMCNHYYVFNNKHKIYVNINNFISLKNKVLKLSNKIQQNYSINKNKEDLIFIKGHQVNIDSLNKSKILYLDNRMSKFKYDLSKCLKNNCYNLYLHTIKDKDNILINKINNYKIIYQLIIYNNNFNINFFNNNYLKNITNNKKEELNKNIKSILIKDCNNLIDNINNLTIEKYKFINQDLLNNICMLNEKLNFIYNINNYNNIIMDNNINNYTYIYDENLNIVGNIALKDKYIKMIGGKILIKEIKDNYKLLYDNNKNKIIKGNYNYKIYIPQCINNYNYITLFLSQYLNQFNNNEDLLLIKQIYIIFYNYCFTNEEYKNYNIKNICSRNNLNKNNILECRLYNIEYGIEELFNSISKNILDIILIISSKLYFIEDMVNYKLIKLCYKIVNEIDFKEKLNLIIKLTNKLKYFNNQKEKPIFLINNMTENYDDKFNDDNFELKYITQLNIYALYYIYNLDLYNDLNKEIKLLLNI